MSKAKWIWYCGDFELYHHMLLSCRRQEVGFDYPCMWRVARPELNVTFYRKFEVPADSRMFVKSNSKGFVGSAGIRYPVNTEIEIKKGTLEVEVQLYDIGAFPSFFIDSEYVKTDESWTAQCGDRVWKPVGCEPAFTKADDDPTVFPFEYETLVPVSVTEINGGKLYDFGKETFGPVTMSGIKAGDTVFLSYGESKEEALDFENAIIREKLTAADEAVRPARAFRYIYVKSEKQNEINLTAQYEYLPIKDIASFECDDEEIKKIWELCSYTFHLNSREFYLDGIKRDRWVWSGDAYQSFIINRYLYADNAITKRTITALLGKPTYHCHINEINDYSAFLIIAVWEYYFATGDRKFVESVWDKVKELCSFIVSRLDENGYVVEVKGDWIFIDWGDVDKDGTLCAEQILLWQMYNSMAKLSDIFEEKNSFAEKAEALKNKIKKDYWREEKCAFIDCYDDGKEHISKQTNTLAVIYDFVDEITAKNIMSSVIDNENVTPITTPYFKLYELIARCKCGDIRGMQTYLKEYWGGMLKLGATSIWEQFDPTKQGLEHYGMYGKTFDKSLCHAWGSGPIYLLGRFTAGVKQTGLAYKTFSVNPDRGLFKNFNAVVPIGDKKISISCTENSVSVFTEAEGGTLIYGGKEYDIPANETLTVEMK